jgi:hypothetical protein
MLQTTVVSESIHTFYVDFFFSEIRAVCEIMWEKFGRSRRAKHGNIMKKGKAVPLQAWSGPEGSRKLRYPDYMTTAQDGGKVVSLTPRPPYHQEMLLVLISVRG